MRTKKEIKIKYNEMLEHTKKLHNIVQNPPDDYSFDDIKNAIVDENTQESMNALVRWVLEEKIKL